MEGAQFDKHLILTICTNHPNLSVMITFSGDAEDREALKAEIEILRQCRHPNIVNYYGCYFREHEMLVRQF